MYEDITEIFILIPALLGLKGNLEMTLASRLSTAVSIDSLYQLEARWQLGLGLRIGFLIFIKMQTGLQTCAGVYNAKAEECTCITAHSVRNMRSVGGRVWLPG